MPFVYSVSASTAGNTATNATPNTETIYTAGRQATRGFNLTSWFVVGKGAGLTALSGIVHRFIRWTTVGTGGTTVTPRPRRIGTTASTGWVDGAPTAGTVTGGYQLTIGHGAAGPGGWVARDEDSKIHLEGTSADELAVYSSSGTASLNFEWSGEIEE